MMLKRLLESTGHLWDWFCRHPVLVVWILLLCHTVHSYDIFVHTGLCIYIYMYTYTCVFTKTKANYFLA